MLAGMHCRTVLMGLLLLAPGLTSARGGDGPKDRPPRGTPGSVSVARRQWLSSDLHLTTGTLVSETIAPGQTLLLCREGFSMVVGNREFAAEQAVVWTVAGPPAEKGAATPYRVQVYLEGSVSDQRVGDGPRTNLTEVVLKRGRAVVIQVDIGGELFITADNKAMGDSRPHAPVPGGGRRLPEGEPGGACSAGTSGSGEARESPKGRPQRAGSPVHDSYQPDDLRRSPIRTGRVARGRAGHHLDRQNVRLLAGAQ